MFPARAFIGSVVLLLFAFAVAPAPVTAHHRWGKYHWSRTANPLSLVVASNVSSQWQSHFTTAVSDWNGSSVLSLTTANGNKDPLTCAPTLGRIEVCNASYGQTNWLGIAQIWTGGGSHIVQAITKLNDTYFNTTQYNSDAWRRFVMCQEIGHDFGLDHQDENFNNTNLGSCMDYTNDPDGGNGALSNLAPNLHDFEMLASIYSHLDGGGTGGGGGGGGRGRAGGFGARFDPPDPAFEHLPGHSQATWGRLIATNGRVARYVLDLGNGNFVFTFVLWA